MSRAKPSKHLRNRVGESQNWRCAYCGVRTVEYYRSQQFFTLDHVRPRANGGAYSYENCVGACYACNHRRGSMEANSFWLMVQKQKTKHNVYRIGRPPDRSKPAQRRIKPPAETRQWDEDRYAT